jgi:CheY-like chemotaxis protein
MNATHSKPCKILLVEDEHIARKVHFMMLQALGHTPDVAETGRQALKMCQLQRYDLIFMDIGLPDIDGLELTRHIHQLDATGHRTPVVALTAFSATDVQDKCLSAGIDNIMTKPVNPSALRSMVSAYIEA